MKKYLALLVVIVALAPLVWFLQFVWRTPGIIIVASAAPALVAAWLASRALTEPRDTGLMVIAFTAGAVLATFISSGWNTYFMSWFTAIAGESNARIVTSSLGAPVLEEIAKALALLAVVLVWRWPTHAIEGAVCGALIGIGFAMTENLSYLSFAMLQGGMPGLAQGVYLRSIIGSIVHATFTASTGAALGYGFGAASTVTRVGLAVTGVLFAITQHLGWNAIAASTIRDLLCAPAVPGGVCSPTTPTRLFIAIPVIVMMAVGPGIAALVVLGRHRPYYASGSDAESNARA
jgi:RsiW-degrading membrane proteinase PrsW (M82 family)